MPALGVQVSADHVHKTGKINVNLVKCGLFAIFSGDPVNITADLLCYVNSCAAGREMVHIIRLLHGLHNSSPLYTPGWVDDPRGLCQPWLGGGKFPQYPPATKRPSKNPPPKGSYVAGLAGELSIFLVKNSTVPSCPITVPCVVP